MSKGRQAEKNSQPDRQTDRQTARQEAFEATTRLALERAADVAKLLSNLDTLEVLSELRQHRLKVRERKLETAPTPAQRVGVVQGGGGDSDSRVSGRCR